MVFSIGVMTAGLVSAVPLNTNASGPANGEGSGLTESDNKTTLQSVLCQYE